MAQARCKLTRHYLFQLELGCPSFKCLDSKNLDDDKSAFRAYKRALVFIVLLNFLQVKGLAPHTEK